MKRIRLKKAVSVGWLAEFPLELWAIIIGYLPTPDLIPNLPLMLTLMGTSKAICSLFKQQVLILLQDFLTFDALPLKNKYCSDEWRPDTVLFACISHFFRVAKPLVDLHIYVDTVLNEALYHTPEHLTNCLSLLRLAYLEGHYLYTHERYDGMAICPLHVYRSPIQQLPKGYDKLKTIMYFNPVTKRVCHLYRMTKDVLCTKFDDYDYYNVGSGKNGYSAYEQAEAYLKTKGDNDKQLSEFRALPFYKKAMRIRTIDIIREHDKLVTHRPKGSDLFRELIVTVGNKQHYIYAEEAIPFKDRCFINVSDNHVETITWAYILHSFHERNWQIVTNTDRFKLPVPVVM